MDEAARGDYNWYYGDTENGTYLDPSPSLAPLLDTGNVRFSYQDSAIRTWLTDTSRGRQARGGGGDGDAARRDRELPPERGRRTATASTPSTGRR